MSQHQEPDRQEPDRQEPDQQEPDQQGPDRQELEWPRPGRWEPGTRAPEQNGADWVRLGVTLHPTAADLLQEYMTRKGVSSDETFRRAIAALMFLDHEFTDSGGEWRDGVQPALVLLANGAVTLREWDLGDLLGGAEKPEGDG